MTEGTIHLPRSSKANSYSLSNVGENKVELIMSSIYEKR